MSAFDKVKGYESIKNEMMMVCDMIRNKEYYDRIGAKLPRGIMLHGEPGLGKTTIANCFIRESGLQAYTLRKTKGGDAFVEEITAVFQKAKENAPSIVLLDDLDKFANEDEDNKNADEYVAAQAGIDDVRETEVIVVATANEIWRLPDSLLRPGRFDRILEMQTPSKEDTIDIIKQYLSDKPIDESVDLDDLAKMISMSSCAELETILNEAARNAAYNRKEKIEMEDFIESVLKTEYDSPDSYSIVPDRDRKKTALHEAGHLVVCETLDSGSVGFASVRLSGRDSMNGFISRCKEPSRKDHHILTLLAGKAAVELYYSDGATEGCSNDISCAAAAIRFSMDSEASHGFAWTDVLLLNTESLNARQELLIQAELERYLNRSKEILLQNRAFLEKTAEALYEKNTLLFSEIQKIKAGTAETLKTAG